MWIGLVQLLVASYSSKILKDIILRLDFSITPDPYNEIKSSTISFPVAHTQIGFVRYKFNCFDRLI